MRRTTRASAVAVLKNLETRALASRRGSPRDACGQRRSFQAGTASNFPQPGRQVIRQRTLPWSETPGGDGGGASARVDTPARRRFRQETFRTSNVEAQCRVRSELHGVNVLYERILVKYVCRELSQHHPLAVGSKRIWISRSDASSSPSMPTSLESGTAPDANRRTCPSTDSSSGISHPPVEAG